MPIIYNFFYFIFFTTAPYLKNSPCFFCALRLRSRRDLGALSAPNVFDNIGFHMWLN
ncbi:hypothetical protein HanRHA438_Chr17g0836351 [Helianthus annuus]|nr:hypothetical protein HanRHA438_Chr17g0836351 [Helianthus annuus]